MKLPWKYLTQLVSRQRSDEPADRSGAADKGRTLVEIELQPADTILDGEPPAKVAVPSALGSEIGVETADLPPAFTEAAKAALKEPEQPSADPHELLLASAGAVATPSLRKAKLKAAKREGAGSEAEITVAIPDTSITVAPSSADLFFQSAASLDEEIKQLEHALAQKLRMQNAQLREMLKRFERS